MIQSLTRLKKYGFNERELTEEELLKICEREKITVLFLEVPTSFYFSAQNRFYIVIKTSLKGLRRTFALAHEVAHHLLHGGKPAASAFFFGLVESKHEFEANACALVALIPAKMLKTFEFLENHPNSYARKLFKEREKLFFLYGI